MSKITEEIQDSEGKLTGLKRDYYPTFTLSSARLADVLKKNIDAGDLSEDQKIYLDALLLNISNHAITTLAEDASITASTKARSAPPAHSRTRAGQYEPVLYELIKEGKTEEIGRLVEKQSITITSHPNFSRSRELAKLSRDLTDALSSLSRSEQHDIQQSGTLPQGETRAKVAAILSKLPAELKPRKKRTRKDEVEETTLDFIPTAMNAASEQLAIIKKRAPQKLEFKSTNQLDAVAELLPEYNSWITDGDGKRTCHVYDTEYMIPAIKRKTYEEYLKQMEKLPDQLGQWNVKAAREKLSIDIAKLAEIEALTIRRMEAFNDLHEKYEAQKGEGRDTPAVSAYLQARRDTQKICEEYIQKVTGSDAAKQLLQGDDASEILTPLAATLDGIYARTLTLDTDRKSAAEELYIKLKHFGNFAVHLQRRENAGQYLEIFKHLIEKQNSVREALVERLAGNYGIDENEIISRMEDKKFLSAAINTFAHDIIVEDKDSKVRKAIKEEYRRLAAKLEKSAKKNNIGSQTPGISALEKEELLTLDGLGHFVMAQYYPEAFKGGFVIAEFGQPGLDVLKRGDEAEIAEEVRRVAVDDMKLQVALAHAMKTNKFDKTAVKIIPLHEDPATLLHTPSAQGTLRGNGSGDSLIANYLLDYMGVSRDNATSKALLTLDKEGKLRELTAYDEMKRLGVSDEELEKRGLNIASLKKTLVLEGPEDMEACSDNSKRAGIIGAELAEWSVREKAIEGAKNPVTLGEQSFIIRKPKYLGQGGAVARATDVPITSTQATWQGEHAASQTSKSLAHTAHHNLLGRLYLTTSASRGETKPQELFAKALSMPHFANRLGLPTHGLTTGEVGLMKEAIDKRIASTRDDPRYDKFLEVYAEPAPNYSARPDSKKAGSKGFAEKRAIGVAAEEAGIFANVIALADIFSLVENGSRKGEISYESLEDIKSWQGKDPALQQRLSAAALIANFVNLKQKWARGGANLTARDGKEFIIKNGHEATLETLVTAYHKNEHVPGFNDADLVMAYLHSQFRKLEKGLLALNKKQSLMEIFDEPHRETIVATKALYDKVLERLQTTKGQKNTDRELLEGVYYLIFEQGGAQFPLPHLLEKPNSKSASVA